MQLMKSCHQFFLYNLCISFMLPLVFMCVGRDVPYMPSCVWGEVLPTCLPGVQVRMHC